MVSKKELLKNNKIKGDSNSIIKQIASDESYFNQLKEEYMAGRRDGELELVRNTLKGGHKKDLNYFLETELDYEQVRRVFEVHQKSIKKSKKYCYIDDIKAIEKIKNIRRRKQVTLEVQLMEVLDKVFARNKKRLKFMSSTEISDFLKRCLAKKLKEKGLELDASRFKPDTFKKMLNIDVRPSNGKKFYTLIGFKDERYITLTYDLETVNEEVKEVA